jgi:hypothetical protein
VNLLKLVNVILDTRIDSPLSLNMRKSTCPVKCR